MDSKQKSKELINSFAETIRPIAYGNLMERDWSGAKECALLCVDEIDAAIDFDWMEVQNLDRQHAHWQLVKEEIEKY